MVDDGKLRVDKFNGKNFQLWKMQVDDYLYQKDLWKLLEGKTKNQGSMSNDEWDLLDRKAVGRILLCLVLLVAFNITKAKTTKDLMKTLVTLYEKISTSNNVFLMNHLFNMKMAEGGSIIDHLNKFNIVTSQLSSSVGINFDEEIRTLLILCSFPKSWNGMVMVVSNYVSGSKTLKFDDVIGVILSEETCTKTQVDLHYEVF